MKSVIILFVIMISNCVHAEFVRRTVLAFYDDKIYLDASDTMIARAVEMPLNHLGLMVEYRAYSAGIPSQKELEDVRGILLWGKEANLINPEGFLDWLIRMREEGIKILLLEGWASRMLKNFKGLDGKIHQVYQSIGLKYSSTWSENAEGLEVIEANKFIKAYEADFSFKKNPGYYRTQISVNGSGVSALTAKTKASEAVLAYYGSGGGYVAEGYLLISYGEKLYWYINPWVLLRGAFGVKGEPAPDVSTVNGKRVFYIHIDGDGWRNVSRIQKYRDLRQYASFVVMEEFVKKYPTVPMTIAPVAADIDANMFGDAQSIEIAKELFLLDNVSAGVHTYTHPLYWQYFEKGYAEENETILHQREKQKNSGAFTRLIETYRNQGKTYSALMGKNPMQGTGYATPRSYFDGRFREERELIESVDHVSSILPKGKKVELFQWSGNARPYQRVMRLLNEKGVLNINGGDSRYDHKKDSLVWLSPISRKVGRWHQIYASNSNENIYYQNFKGVPFGLSHVMTTYQWSEAPIRLKPANLYFHMYAGVNRLSINELHRVLSFSQRSDYFPAMASQYSKVAQDFFRVKINRTEDGGWEILDKGMLNTVRFDFSSNKKLDMSRSMGVLGQKHFQGSLYIHLDPDHKSPKVYLKPWEMVSFLESEVKKISLIDANYQIKKYRNEKDQVVFTAQGWGKGRSRWNVPKRGCYQVLEGEKTREICTETQILNLNLSSVSSTQVELTSFTN